MHILLLMLIAFGVGLFVGAALILWLQGGNGLNDD